MLSSRQPIGSLSRSVDPDWPILICLLGSFKVVQAGGLAPVRCGKKLEALLCQLALRSDRPVARDALLEALWPASEPELAGQSLNTLMYSAHKVLGDAIGGASPILHEDGSYQLNVDAGVGTDIACFDSLVNAGDEQASRGDSVAAAALFGRAVDLYRGDLCIHSPVSVIVAREHLRARYLTLLGRLADHYYSQTEYASCLEAASRLLENDPCREDAHRAVMRCYVRMGERAQALRQYRLCLEILNVEFGAQPEPETRELFERVRDQPASI